jgi:hypothetical protein
MHGEPTMNPDILRIIGAFRERLPRSQLMMTTNGVGLLLGGDILKNIGLCFNAGLNILAIDCYEHYKASREIKAALKENQAELFRRRIPVYNYPIQPEGNPHKRLSGHGMFITLLQDLNTASMGTHSQLCNHCGCASPTVSSHMTKKCAKPFREMAIRWDGNVAICCNDFRGVYKVENILYYDNIQDLWDDEAFKAARRRLILGQRDFEPCIGCNDVSYRVGLLPDPAGQDEYPDPYESDMTIIKSCNSGNPYTKPVQREWEL